MNSTAALPQKVCDEVLTHCQVNGAIPVTTRSIEQLLTDMIRPLRDSLANLQRPVGPPAQERRDAEDVDVQPPRFSSWTWGGRIHPVPHDFKFPNCSVPTTWNLWFFGNSAERISPFRQFKNFDMQTKRDKSYLSRSRSIMKLLCGIAIRDGKIANLEALQRSDRSSSSTIFQYCFEIMMGESLRHREGRRISELSLSAVYNDVVLFKKKAMNNEEEEEEEN